MPYLLPEKFINQSLPVAFAFNLFKKSGRFTGAAFLMATAAIGPGFITQTTVFTSQLFTSFGFIILVSIILDIVVQLNIWRVIAVSGFKAPVLANRLLPGLGILLAAMVSVGGLFFNIGNIGGCGLALNSLTGMSFGTGALLSGGLAILLFLIREFGKAMDMFTRLLGFVMIGLMLYVAFTAHPPVGDMIKHTFFPERWDVVALVTLVGGTVGGYISFAGAHRMLDAGFSGTQNLKEVNQGAITGILLAGFMRILLFAAVAGVVAKGIVLPKENPAAAIFQSAAGEAGLRIFGVILWSAAITSVVAAAYTSVSFIACLHPFIQKYQRAAIILFILASTLIFYIIGNPTQLLVSAGTVNGLVLPLSLGIILLSIRFGKLPTNYVHPKWLLVSGWGVTGLLLVMSIRAVYVFIQSSA